MALTSLPTTAPAPLAGCARRIEVTATATVLVLDDGRRAAIPCLPDPAGAQRVLRLLNRPSSIRLEGTVPGLTAHLRGLGNRHPIDLSIPLSAALAIIDAGVPAVVRLQFSEAI